MSYHIYFRVLGYVVTLAMHISNLVCMRRTIKEGSMTASELESVGINTFTNMEYRYLTTWTVGLQIGYAFLGLFCDVLILINRKKKNFRLPQHLQAGREIMFGGIVWPSTFVVCIIFWTLFLYDRSLVFPIFLDKIVTNTSNHVIHTAIVPVVLWEVMFWPRKEPKSHARNVMQLSLHMMVYASVIHFTHFETGVWLYPIMEVLQGTIHFALFHVYVVALAYVSYIAQWKLSNFIHHRKSVKTDTKKKVK